MAAEDQKRLNYIDAARGIGLLFIMWGHVSYLSNPVSYFGSSFKLAIFYIISGYLFTLKPQPDNKAFESNRLKVLGIPYVFYSVLAILAGLVTDTIQGYPVKEWFFDNICATLSLRGVSALWFLPSLFLSELIFLYLIRNKRPAIQTVFMVILPFICIVLAGLYAILPQMTGLTYIDKFISYFILTWFKALTGCWFYGIGYFCLNRILKMFKPPVIILAGGLDLFLSQINTGVDLNYLQFGRFPLCFFICGIAGSAAVISLLQWICGYHQLYFLEFLGRNSLFIMATHLPLGISTMLLFVEKRLILFEEATAGYYLTCVGCLITLIIIETALVYIWKFIKTRMAESPKSIVKSLYGFIIYT